MSKPGETNVEIAHKLLEKEEKDHQCKSQREATIEILEAIILALVAISTAWSGYQASLWSGHQTELFYESTNLSLIAEGLILAEGQDTIYNTVTLNGWLIGQMQGRRDITKFYERRFLPEFKIAFDEWIKTDPLNNDHSPPGPRYMSGYKSSKTDETKKLNEEVYARYNEGMAALQTSHDYIRNTVSLAIVLVLVAINQRFEIKSVRRGLILISLGLLAYCVMNLLTLPIIW